MNGVNPANLTCSSARRKRERERERERLLFHQNSAGAHVRASAVSLSELDSLYIYIYIIIYVCVYIFCRIQIAIECIWSIILELGCYSVVAVSELSCYGSSGSALNVPATLWFKTPLSRPQKQILPFSCMSGGGERVEQERQVCILTRSISSISPPTALWRGLFQSRSHTSLHQCCPYTHIHVHVHEGMPVPFLNCFKDISYAHQDCIYLIKNTEK